MVLLDTQVLLWWLSDDARLGAEACRRMAYEDLLLSPVSLWEIAIKAGLGKLEADVGAVARAADAGGIKRVPMSDAHFIAYQALPRREGHGDPFDRMLVAQSIIEKVPLLTADSKLSGYAAAVIDARR